MEKCKICGKEFKKLTSSHLKKHGITYNEYLKKYEAEKYEERCSEKELIRFLNDYYITARYRFWQCNKDKKGIIYKRTVENGKGNRTESLNDLDLHYHLGGNKTIGIYFPSGITKLIAFDIDIPDIELLNRLYNTLMNYGIKEENILMSFSGQKGYHLDIFLDKELDMAVVKKFHEVILGDIKATEKEVELRGGDKRAYKLPFGYHIETEKYCFACNEWGREIDIKDKIRNIKKINIAEICDIVEINYNFVSDSRIQLMNQYEELDSTVKMLPKYQNTNENRIRQFEKLIKKGLHDKERSRHECIRDMAAFCKDIKGMCLAETITFLTDWVNNTWDKTLIDKEVKGHIKNATKSVYRTGFIFSVQANAISVSLPEIEKIFNLKTNNKLQTEALRRLYYMFLIHSKAYADSDGVFGMTYNQLMEMGANKNKTELIPQINKLEELGKLIIVERNRKIEGTYLKGMNKYKLPEFITFKKELSAFNICQESERCKDCMYKALCYLADDKERRKHIKGKEFKNLQECPYNK